MRRNRAAVRWVAIAVVAAAVSLSAAPAGGLASIRSQDLRDWLSYIASDDLEGRAVFTEPASAWPRPTSRTTCANGA